MFSRACDASAKTRLIGRPPKTKTLEQSRKRPRAIIMQARMIIVLIAVKSCRTPRRGRQHRRARKRARHRQRAYTVGELLRRDIADWGMSWTLCPERRPTSTRRHAAPGDRCNPSRRVVPSGTSWPSDHPRRPPCHTPDTVSPESRIAVANHPRQSRATSTLKEEHACLDPVWAPYL